jgi:multidrug efflux system outer membrane protein
MIRPGRAAAFALALALTGCAVGPDYQRTGLNLPGTYRGQAENPVADSIGDASWWDVYGDSNLRDLLTTALRNNLDLKVAVARIDEAHATLGVARLGLAPQVDLQGSISRTKGSRYALLPGAPRFNDVEQVSVGVSWELDLWGRLRRSNEAARATLLSTEYARKAVSVTLVASIATAYFNLLALDSQLEITKRTVNTRERFVKLTRAQHDRGYATGLDVATAEAQEAVARANVPDLERRIGETENAISVLLGDNPHGIAREQAGDEAPGMPPVPPAGLPSALLERRPDIRAAEEQLHAANAQIGVARAALFPTIALTGTAGSLSAPLGKLFTAPAAEWSVAAGLVQPLLDSQRSLYQVQLADARKREALYQYQKAVQTAFQEVADALLELQKYEEFAREQTTEVEALRRADAIALARYRVGYASYFDVINADRDLFSAELSLSQAHANSRSALVRLYQVLGGGWQPVPAS